MPTKMPTKTTWRAHEIPLRAESVPPGGIGVIHVGLAPVPKCLEGSAAASNARAFQPFALITTAEHIHFGFVRWYIGDRPMMDEREQLPYILARASMQDVDGTVPVAEVGQVISIYVKNKSTEARTFTGKLTGYQRFEEDVEGLPGSFMVTPPAVPAVRVLFFGSDRINGGDHLDQIKAVIDALPEGAVVMHSNVSSTERLAGHLAQARGLQVQRRDGEWEGFFRREYAVATCVHAFWDGKPGNTDSMVRKADAIGIEVVRHVLVHEADVEPVTEDVTEDVTEPDTTRYRDTMTSAARVSGNSGAKVRVEFDINGPFIAEVLIICGVSMARDLVENVEVRVDGELVRIEEREPVIGGGYRIASTPLDKPFKGVLVHGRVEVTADLKRDSDGFYPTLYGKTPVTG